MNQNLQAMHKRLDDAARQFGIMGQELRSMQDIGKNIDDLRSAFFSPKLRGNFGEQVLNDMLDANFPKDLYEVQHKFKDGQTVDAVIKTRDGLIPVDSKFPVDNYRKMILATTDEDAPPSAMNFSRRLGSTSVTSPKNTSCQGRGRSILP